MPPTVFSQFDVNKHEFWLAVFGFNEGVTVRIAAVVTALVSYAPPAGFPSKDHWIPLKTT